MFFTIIATFILLQTSKCSLVIDGLDQRGVYVSHYCPKMQHCPEGSHVMCMYYNPNRVMGPVCSNPQNVTITAELAEKLLDLSNAIRSKLAFGNEKGRNGAYLPRAYGMFRLKWDNELATFAQVLANQCVLKHDMCRASNRFSDPGQVAGIVRFFYPNWKSSYKPEQFPTPGLTTAKLIYAVEQSFKSWYIKKNEVTPEMITNYPDTAKSPYSSTKLYLEMIHGPATHMGCGLSAYNEYAYYDNNAPLNYNVVQVVCNFSSRPHKGLLVYTSDRPTSSGYTVRCGCPMGSNEDDDCLCNQGPRACVGVNCKPTVVLLPIFTVEDAPPQKLISAHDGTSNYTSSHKDIMDILDFGNLDNNHLEVDGLSMHNAYNKPHASPAINLQTVSRNQILDVKNRYFNKNPTLSAQRYEHSEAIRTAGKHVQLKKKQSIFARPAKFELGRKNDHNTFETSIPNFKNDVSPRKDFKKSQDLAQSYLIKKRNHITFQATDLVAGNSENNAIVRHNKIIDLTTEPVLQTAEERVIHYNKYLRQNPNLTKEVQSIYSKRFNEEADNKLMTLLDHLEREVKHIELDGNEKEIFDAKIRKIYGAVVGNPVDLVDHTEPKIEDDDFLENDMKESENSYKDVHSSDRFIGADITSKKLGVNSRGTTSNNKYLQPIYKERPLANRHNSLVKYRDRNKNYKDYRDTQNYKHNMLSSYEDNNTNYGTSNDEVKARNTYRSGLERSIYRSYDSFDEPIPRIDEREYRESKKYLDVIRNPDDVLSAERRRYYQEKLDNLERRLHRDRTRNYKQRNAHENGLQMRPIRPAAAMQIRPSRSKNQIDSFYMPDRARFLHGF